MFYITFLPQTNATETIDPDITKCGANYCPSPASPSASGNSSSGGSCESPDSKTQTIFVIFLGSVSVGLVLWALLPNLSRLTKAERGPLDCKSLSEALVGGFIFTFQDFRVRRFLCLDLSKSRYVGPLPLRSSLSHHTIPPPPASFIRLFSSCPCSFTLG